MLFGAERREANLIILLIQAPSFKLNIVGKRIFNLRELCENYGSVIPLNLPLLVPSDFLGSENLLADLLLEDALLVVPLISWHELPAQTQSLLQTLNSLVNEVGVDVLLLLSELHRGLSELQIGFEVIGTDLDSSVAVLVHELELPVQLESRSSVCI